MEAEKTRTFAYQEYGSWIEGGGCCRVERWIQRSLLGVVELCDIEASGHTWKVLMARMEVEALPIN